MSDAIDKQRERLGLAAIWGIINSAPIGKSIPPNTIKKVSKVLKEFDRVVSGKFRRIGKKGGPQLEAHRWKKKLVCYRWPFCGGKCLKK